MNNRERNWYEGKYGRHPPTCRCPECETWGHQLYNDMGYDTAGEDRRGRQERSWERETVPPPPSPVAGGGRRGSFESSRRFTKVMLVLVVLAGIWLLPWLGYKVFSTPNEPLLWEPIALALCLVIWIASIRLLRSRRLVSTHVRSTVRVATLIFLALLVSSLVSVGVQRGLVSMDPSSSLPDSSGGTDSLPSDILPSDHSPVDPVGIVDGIDHHTGEYGDYHLGLVYTADGVLGGAGCYDDEGEFIVLINNEGAIDPSYSRLVNFLQQDDTDQFPYVYDYAVDFYYGSAESNVNLSHVQGIIDGASQPNSPNMCGDFAERLHNNAELAGIRCGYVDVELADGTNHACNAFQTTDRGLIYVDVTGWGAGTLHPDRAVATVDISVGHSYTPVSLFHEEGWSDTCLSMGTVTNFQVVWDGSWGG